jgi:hypothetical protein
MAAEARHGTLFPCLAANYGPDWPGITALLAGDYGYMQREQNASRDVNRMMVFALALLPDLLFLSLT